MPDELTLPTTWINWFEIPVTDFERAKAFYEAIFEIELFVNDLGVIKMGLFPNREVGCAIVQNEFYKPGKEGPLIYLNANPDLQAIMDRVEKAGGQVVVARKQISPEHGFMGVFTDSEGNRIALHSNA